MKHTIAYLMLATLFAATLPAAAHAGNRGDGGTHKARFIRQQMTASQRTATTDNPAPRNRAEERAVPDTHAVDSAGAVPPHLRVQLGRAHIRK